MTFLNTLDSRTVLLVTSLATTIALIFGGPLFKDVAFAGVFCFLLLAAKRYRLVSICVVTLVVIHTLAYWLTYSELYTSAATMWLLAGGFRKFFFILSSGFFLFTVINVSDCIIALEKMKAPWTLIVPVAICFRFLPTILDEGRFIRDAMKIRGLLSFSHIVTHPVATLELFLSTLLFRAISLGEELAHSISTRAPSGERRHVWYREKNFSAADFFFTLAILGIVLAIAAFQWPASLTVTLPG